MDNVDVVRRIEAAYNAQDYDALGGLIASDVVKHTPGAGDLPPGIEGCIAADQGSWQAFPDKSTEIAEIFGEGDRVVSRVHFTGTNKGGMPWMGVPANDAAVDIEWIQISRHGDDGKVVETWAQMDLPTMMVQLGMMPAPEGM